MGAHPPIPTPCGHRSRIAPRCVASSRCPLPFRCTHGAAASPAMTRHVGPPADSLPPMAMTQQPRVDGDRPRLQPDAVFDARIWHNAEICNHCFGRVRTVETEEIHVGKNNQRQLDFEHRDRTSHATTDHDVEAKGETGLIAIRDADGRVTGLEPIETHSAQYRETTRTTCLQCGSIGCLATDETLSRREALDRVDALVARLSEQGIPVSERHLREGVRRGKSRADTQGYDREIFTAAVKVAVRHG